MHATHQYSSYPTRRNDRQRDVHKRSRPREKKKNPSVCFNDIHEDLHTSIDSFKSLHTLKLTPAAEIEHVITHILNVSSEDYRLLGKLTVFTDSSGKAYPLDAWKEIIIRTNLAMKTCVNGKMIKTYYVDDTLQSAQAPSGTHVFAVPREITENLIQDALRDANNVYWNPKHRANKTIHIIESSPSPACNMLFYPGCGKQNPSIKDVFQVLFAEAPALARYSMIYLKLIKDILKLDDGEEELVNMCLNHYDPNAAINPHVDTVGTFNGTLGPIFTVAMGASDKMVDLLPVLRPDSFKPMRIFTKPNELLLMDGEVRALWAHSKPLNYPYDQFTLVFKCPEFKNKTHEIPFEYEGNNLVIPCHYATPFKSKSDALP